MKRSLSITFAIQVRGNSCPKFMRKETVVEGAMTPDRVSHIEKALEELFAKEGFGKVEIVIMSWQPFEEEKK